MTQEAPPGTCPICGDDDQARRISAVIHSGTSSSRAGGWGLIAGTGIGLGGGYGRSLTTTALVDRFQHERRPGGLTFAGFVLWFIVLVVAIVATIGQTSPLMSLTVAVVVATVVLLVGRAVTAPRWRRARANWDEAHSRVQSGYYCLRDDVCFEPGGTTTWAPEEYALRAYRG